MENSVAVFRQFLGKYVLNPILDLYDGESVHDLIEKNFDLLDERIMRLLIQEALKERDSRALEGLGEQDLLGSWGVVIDSVR